jgi:hypothetical protein
MSTRFLLIYRTRGKASAMVAEAPTLADALELGAKVGLTQPMNFRLGQELDADLSKLVRPDQVNRVLTEAETKELLATFETRAR